MERTPLEEALLFLAPEQAAAEMAQPPEVIEIVFEGEYLNEPTPAKVAIPTVTVSRQKELAKPAVAKKMMAGAGKPKPPARTKGKTKAHPRGH